MSRNYLDAYYTDIVEQISHSEKIFSTSNTSSNRLESVFYCTNKKIY